MSDWKMVKMPDGNWHKAQYAGTEYGWVSDTGNYIGDDSPSSKVSTPVAVVDMERLDTLIGDSEPKLHIGDIIAYKVSKDQVKWRIEPIRDAVSCEAFNHNSNPKFRCIVLMTSKQVAERLKIFT